MTVAGTLQVKTALAGSITLTTPANGTDTFKIIRGDPEFAASGGEVIVYAAGGTDNRNPLSGNRIGLSIFGWRSTTEAIPTRIGSLLNLIGNPNDANLVIDRGVNAQGHFDRLIDFTAANLVVDSYFMKLNSSGAGIDKDYNMSLGAFAPTALPGITTIKVGNLSNGGMYQATDGTIVARWQTSVATASIFGTETAHDLILWRNATERFRVGNSAITFRGSVAGGLLLGTDGTATGRMQVSAAAGIIFGSDTAHDTLFTRGGSERMRLTAPGNYTGVQIAAPGTTYANDAAAAAGGVPVNGVYRNGSVLQIRVV